ncbi:hypothetical protein Vadar_011678 [Vaccinium darrowii]|uniref:Uncharacterized protein n=1 Tax=Vaccinium darrowii TaxID=229202 RepID=A0ACB7XZ45_9ERIC|nr:hypothetical protein Vadar_011678 [Vaccinium darrowii]
MVAKNVSTMIVMISITLIPMVVMSYGPEMEGTATPRVPAPFADVSCPNFRTRDLTDPYVAIAGDAVWEGDWTCGKKFKITCISSVDNLPPCPCKPDTSVVVTIVDHCLTQETCTATGDAFYLSTQAFDIISYPSPNINVKYERVYY